jgi:L-type amino acid transporter 10
VSFNEKFGFFEYVNIMIVIGALCYAEIGGLIPRNGAEIAYMKEGIGSVHERIGEILAYLFVWTSAFILKPASIAVLTLTFSQYFLSGIFLGKLFSQR